MSKLPETQNVRRGLVVDDNMQLLGADGIYALGDATATSYAPTAQCAAQQGTYLARVFARLAKKELLEAELIVARQNPTMSKEDESKLVRQIGRAGAVPFTYSHQGSLAYIGSDKAIADLPVWGAGNFATGGMLTYLFWRSAYISSRAYLVFFPTLKDRC